MKKIFITLLFAISSQTVSAETIIETKDGQYILPNSNFAASGEMHSNLILFRPNNLANPNILTSCETPASIACIYGLTPEVPGCPIVGTTANPTGGWGAIALVEGFDYAMAETDLNVFSAQFGLPPCTTANGCFQVAYTTPSPPPPDSSTADEHVLDIEWAHAMAPQAKIIMVEAKSISHNDLMDAVDLAGQLVAQAGGGMVSYSHSTAEYSTELADDIHFQQPGVVYFGSSGDDAAPANYPATSPYVIAAGGTTIVRDAQGNFVTETAWSANPALGNGGSGGPSLYEPRPAFQNSVIKIVGSARGTPDISFNADPNSGVCTYSTGRGWFSDGGTSVSAPALAGIINSAGVTAGSSQQKLMYIYNNALKNYPAYWHDTVAGNNGFPALRGYDFTTGLGSPLGYAGK